MQKIIIKITQENTNLIFDNRIECFILESSLPLSFIERFIIEAHKVNKLVLISIDETNITMYKALNPDGFIIDTTKDSNPKKKIKNIQTVAPHSIIGVISRNRRHEAMLISECEPDFIIFKFWQDGFEENNKLLEWYNDLFLIQNAAQIEEDLKQQTINSDFLILDEKKYKFFVAK